MKRIILLAAVLLSVTTMAFADCGKCPMDMGKKKHGYGPEKMAKMIEKLGLSEEQATQMKAIHEEKMEKKKAIYEEKKEKMDALREEYKLKVDAILTDEQKLKHAEMMEKKEKKMMKMKKMDKKGMGEGHKHMKRPDMMDDDMDESEGEEHPTE